MTLNPHFALNSFCASMFGALTPGFQSLASLILVVECWRTETEKNSCGIARFPRSSTAFLYNEVTVFTLFNSLSLVQCSILRRLSFSLHVKLFVSYRSPDP